mgnify:CR=1 FL=1
MDEVRPSTSAQATSEQSTSGLSSSDATSENSSSVNSSNENSRPHVAICYRFVGSESTNGKISTYIFECLLCERSQNIRAGVKSSYNLRTHILRRHPDNFSDFVLASENKNSKGKKRKLNETHDDYLIMKRVEQNEMDSKVTEMIVQEMLPFKFVEAKTFRNLIETLRPGCNVMSRKTLVTRLSSQYKDMIHKLKVSLESVKFVGTTADFWSCRHR